MRGIRPIGVKEQSWAPAFRYRRYPAGWHVVFYREVAGTLDVIGIPHHWMHFDRHLERRQLRQR